MMITTLILTTLLVDGSIPAPKFIQAGRPYISVRMLHAIDNLDKGDALGKNRADFFAIVIVNGVTYKTEIMSKDRGNPNWIIPMDRTKRYSKVHFTLMDDDGGLEGKDDHVDINPRSGHKDLMFTFDRSTGRISGDVTGRMNQKISSTGAGDNDKGEISFVVTKK
jgi:hypothetical protein